MLHSKLNHITFQNKSHQYNNTSYQYNQKNRQHLFLVGYNQLSEDHTTRLPGGPGLGPCWNTSCTLLVESIGLALLEDLAAVTLGLLLAAQPFSCAGFWLTIGKCF